MKNFRINRDNIVKIEDIKSLTDNDLIILGKVAASRIASNERKLSKLSEIKTMLTMQRMYIQDREGYNKTLSEIEEKHPEHYSRFAVHKMHNPIYRTSKKQALVHNMTLTSLGRAISKTSSKLSAAFNEKQLCMLFRDEVESEMSSRKLELNLIYEELHNKPKRIVPVTATLQDGKHKRIPVVVKDKKYIRARH